MTRRSRRSRTMSRFRRSVGTAGVLALAVLALAPSAHAEVILHEKFAGSSRRLRAVWDRCTPNSSSEALLQLRVGKGDLDSAFFLLLRIRTTETITNPANGDFLVIEGNNLLHDTKATSVGGSLFRFTSIEAGQPFVLRDMTGGILLRDRGHPHHGPVRHARGRHPGRCDLGGARCERGRTPSRVLHGRRRLLRPGSGPHRLKAPARPGPCGSPTASLTTETGHGEHEPRRGSRCRPGHNRVAPPRCGGSEDLSATVHSPPAPDETGVYGGACDRPGEPAIPEALRPAHPSLSPRTA